MKKRFAKAALAVSLLSMPALSLADEYNSLFAIEGSYSNIDVETLGVNGVNVQNNGFGGVGLKIGAESREYRLFISGRYFDAKDFNKLNTIGAEFQYKFNFSKPVNFFIGGNVGYAYMKVVADPLRDLPSADTNSVYYGADAGFNYHLNEMIDLEAGIRFMKLNENITVRDLNNNSVNYDFSSFTSGYASVIIKWQMEDLY